MIDDLNTWQTEWANIPLVADESWKQTMGDYLEARTSGMDLPGIGGPGFSWAFNTSLFVAGLASVSASTGDGVEKIADAFESAILASTLSVAPGSWVGVSTPASTWSVVNTTIFDAPSISLGKNKILELTSAPLVTDALNSEFPIKLRDAWLLLTVTTSGLDSTPPPAGPLPLVDAARAVG